MSLRSGSPTGPTLETVGERLNELLVAAVAVVRERFDGPVAYAAGRWERVDWDLFDDVGLDYYRDGQSDDEYAQGLRDAAAHGKPVRVYEIGCCTYEGADKRGGTGWMVLDEWNDDGPAWVDGAPPERSEATQARYLQEQMAIYEAEGVDAAFVFTFSQPYLTHDSVDAQHDVDRASYSLTKLYRADTERGQQFPPWEPKESFHALASIFAGFAAARAA
jgi:hypothetical protein